MSYPYDSNPWDDNYTAAGGGASQQQGDGYGAYGSQYTSSGFSDPVQIPGYSSSASTMQYQPQTRDQEPAYDDQQPQAQQPEQPDSKRSDSMLGRFLRQHVPLCGPIMDTLSSINLPFIDALVQHINRDLLVSKMFYFFFYSAFGSLFPLMGVYFKQLGMNPAQVGILTGVRPFIEIFSAPFWHSLADRFHKSKALLLFSVLSWIIFTYSLAHIRPPASACVAFNDTDYVLYVPYSANDLSNYDVGSTEENEAPKSQENEAPLDKMPQSAIATGDREGKEGILASEENQNDQRKRKRRRRRKRQVSYELEGAGDQQPQVVADDSTVTTSSVKHSGGAHKNTRYLYSLDNNGDDGYESHLDLDIDLENDFHDRLIANTYQRSDSQASSGRQSSYFELENPSAAVAANDDDSLDRDELEQQQQHELESKDSRRRRRFVRNVGSRGADDMLGESEESESQPEEQSQRAKASRLSKGGDEAEEQADDSESENEVEISKATAAGKTGKGNNGSEEEEEEEESGESAESESGNNREPQRQQQQQQLTTGAATTSVASHDMRPGESGAAGAANKTKKVYKQRHKTPPTHIVGMSPITVEYAVNYNKDKHSRFVTPMFSTIVYKLDDIKEVFFLLLLLISLGEFFSAPALTLADSATLSYLGDNTDLYGRQRMFGSLSWAITLLLVGMALDSATSIADHPCGPHQRERSYTVCFIIFSLLMACAFLTATQFRFNYPKSESGRNQQAALIAKTADENSTVVTTTTIDGAVAEGGNIDQIYASTQPRSIFNTAPPVNAPPPQLDASGKEKFEFLDKWKSAVFAQNTWEVPEWVNVFRQFRNSLHLMYLFITWFLGCGVGLVFTFLFWHLQDVGGTPTLFGICSVINHISEILAYFFSFNFIKRFGHTRVLSVGLGCNVIRFVYVAFLTDPYYALPFEFVQGITHAACFAACCSYISHVSKPELRTSTQGVMQGLHHGIGRACGALLGGYMINAIGSRASFCIYGLLSGCVLAGFLYVRKKASRAEEEEFKVYDNNEALGGYGAPQGVPSAIPGKIAQNVPAQEVDYQW